MINDNKEHFMNAVKIESEKYKNQLFDSCMVGFMSSVIKEATILDVPKDMSIDDKVKLSEEIKTTVETTSKNIVGDAKANPELSENFSVDFAHEIVNPKNLTESISKTVADHVFEETEGKVASLEALYDSGAFTGKSMEDVHTSICDKFETIRFDQNSEVGANLKREIKQTLSIEGQEVIESIKSEIKDLIDFTETKNTIIREAIGNINEKKQDIEEKINGESTTSNDIADADGVASSDSESEIDSDVPEGEETQTSEKTEKEGDSSTDSTESLKRFGATNIITKNDLYVVSKVFSNLSGRGTEDLSKEYDKSSYSKESADRILKEFKLLDDVDTENVPENENTMSVSDGEQTLKPNTDELEKDEDAEMSEENFAKDILPLSLNKLKNQSTIIDNKKMAAFLALQPDNGEMFFKTIQNRKMGLLNLMGTEGILDNAEDDINVKLNNIITSCETLKNNRDIIVNSLGTLGLSNTDYKRSNNKVDNAVISLINPKILSKESLEENEIAEIFKLALKLSDLTSDTANGIDVHGNVERIGYIEELLNEKMLELEPGDRLDVKMRLDALMSLESVIPFEDMVNMQAFVSEYNGLEKPQRVTLDSFKNIDIYGYSYIDEIQKIKDDLKTKFSDKITNKDNVVNFDIDELVNYICEEIDTTKISSNLYEKVISKLVENRTITNSTEGLFVRNKAKLITTAFVAANSLGFMIEEGINDLNKNLI